MSPTAAILIRFPARSRTGAGAVSAAGAVTSASGGGRVGGIVSSAGCVAQPLTQNKIQMQVFLVTQADPQNVDFRIVQAPAHEIEFIEIARRTDAHPMVGSVVDRHALDVRLDPL